MDNIKFEDFIGKMQRLIDEARKQNAFHEFIESKDKNKPKGCIVKEDFNEGNGYYKVNLAYLNKEQVEEIENLIEKWNPTDEDIKACIGMCLTDVNEQRFKDYGTNLRDCLAWLEKQGEQKQDPCNNCKDVRLNCHNFPCVKKRAFKQGKSVLEVINEEKVDNANKVEQKFHEGDWISGYYTNYKVLSVNNDGYLVEDVDGNKINILFENEKFHHLFTIADAKDGDVLVNGSNIFIFSHLSDTRAMGYCHINIDDGRFYDDKGKNECFGLIDAVFSPATKEQRDTLMKAMTDAGYEWDAEKKELKLLITNGGDFCESENCEQNPAWSEEDELHIRELESLVKQVWTTAEHENDKDTIHKMSDLSFFLKTLKPQPKQEWSEMDKAMTRLITSDLELLKNRGYGEHGKAAYRSEIKWLKSLKDRVQPQNNSITDEELEQAKKDAYNDALDKIEYHSGEPTFADGWHAAIDCIKKKSFKPNLQWKPSDEQMKALENIIAKHGAYNDDLLSLISDLKKLNG